MSRIKPNDAWFLANSKTYADALSHTQMDGSVTSQLVLGGLMMVTDPETFSTVIKAEFAGLPTKEDDAANYLDHCNAVKKIDLALEAQKQNNQTRKG